MGANGPSEPLIPPGRLENDTNGGSTAALGDMCEPPLHAYTPVWLWLSQARGPWGRGTSPPQPLCQGSPVVSFPAPPSPPWAPTRGLEAEENICSYFLSPALSLALYTALHSLPATQPGDPNTASLHPARGPRHSLPGTQLGGPDTASLRPNWGTIILLSFCR